MNLIRFELKTPRDIERFSAVLRQMVADGFRFTVEQRGDVAELTIEEV